MWLRADDLDGATRVVLGATGELQADRGCVDLICRVRVPFERREQQWEPGF
jgi:hypothetical protein